MKPLVLFVALIFSALISCAQDLSALPSTRYGISNKVLEKIISKTTKAQDGMARYTRRALQRLQREETRLAKRLAAQDSSQLQQVQSAQDEYSKLLGDLSASRLEASVASNVYSGQLDSLKTALTFFKANHLPAISLHDAKILQAAQQRLGRMQASLNVNQRIVSFLQSRKEAMKQAILHKTAVASMKRFYERIATYQNQAEEYKAMIEHPQRLGAQALAAVKKLPLFQRFFSNHSDLASMFVLPGATDPDVGKLATDGLQTRATVQQAVQSRFGKEFNVQQMVANNVTAAGQHQANSFMSLPSLSLPAINTHQQMPTATSDAPRGRPLRKRLEYAVDVQTIKATNYWPVTTDMAASIGYRWSTNTTIGLGASFKMGWGPDWRHLAFSCQGVGLRSFMDLKIKGSMSATLGAELNHQRLRGDHLPASIKDWQQSVLAGVTKRYQVSSKLQGKMQLLFDALHAQHVPATPAVLFRLGYCVPQR